MNPTDLHTPSWHVLTVKKGCEKKVSRDLQALGFEVLLPFRRVYRLWSDGRKELQGSCLKAMSMEPFAGFQTW